MGSRMTVEPNILATLEQSFQNPDYPYAWVFLHITSKAGEAISPGVNVLSPLSVFFDAGMFFFEYSAFASSINFCLCSYSRLMAASFADEERDAW